MGGPKSSLGGDDIWVETWIIRSVSHVNMRKECFTQRKQLGQKPKDGKEFR